MKKIKLFEEFTHNSKLKIGLYHDKGVVDSTISAWNDFFKDFFNIEPIKLDSDSFIIKNFEKLDLLIIPGGDSFQERLGMKEQSTLELIEWVKEGGKLLAVCAGFHLIAGSHDWSLGMLSVKSSDTTAAPGTTEPEKKLTEDIVHLDFRITDFGKTIFQTEETIINLYFHGGPVVHVNDSQNLKVLLTFAEEVPHQLPVPQFSKGAAAAIYSKFRNGNIISISPHIEKTPNHQNLLSNAINFLLNI